MVRGASILNVVWRAWMKMALLVKTIRLVYELSAPASVYVASNAPVKSYTSTAPNVSVDEMARTMPERDTCIQNIGVPVATIGPVSAIGKVVPPDALLNLNIRFQDPLFVRRTPRYKMSSKNHTSPPYSG